MNKQTGFTLIELIVTLAVGAILVAVAMPMYTDVVMNNRIVAHSNQFLADMNSARTAAIQYQRSATICVSTSYSASPPSCTAGTDWSAGWIVWADLDQDGAIDADEVLKVNGPLAGNTTFTSASRNSFTYNALGFINANENFSVCDSRTAETGRQVVISNAGRPEIQNFTCS